MTVLGSAQTDEDAGGGAFEAVGRRSGMIERLAGDLEQQPLLGVHDLGFTGGDAEEVRIESVDALEEGAPPRGALHQGGDLGGRTGKAPPAFLRYLTHRVGSRQQVLPERVRSMDATRQATADPDDGDVDVDALCPGTGSAVAGRVVMVLCLRLVHRVQGTDQLPDGGVFPQQGGGQRAVQHLLQVSAQRDSAAGGQSVLRQRACIVDLFRGHAGDLGDESVQRLAQLAGARPGRAARRGAFKGPALLSLASP